MSKIRRWHFRSYDKRLARVVEAARYVDERDADFDRRLREAVQRANRLRAYVYVAARARGRECPEPEWASIDGQDMLPDLGNCDGIDLMTQLVRDRSPTVLPFMREETP